ncbi:TIGR02710 family CRISPR-associated CARF protein [Methanonatronarchaeum sp. AMET-Sl]|uniref:TIGR02710 family CRISPR-associated CARF protein n=1 Tax=Methanonatronarchaeum sp. AMET-Sl TaxID=3037654 RepID=UPI00244DD8EE|nr:TIGR02710 family CRISPR-associated CARF protein [Methanonatronarchaeum sp. AMET-Sl]WGI17158.1 TIGR02710 family CRISPR-associated CARF protein [Methanonatronarchaeum sp. AMET-Sl]
MKRALISTVGKREGIDRVVLRSIQEHNPDLVGIMTTPATREQADSIEEKSKSIEFERYEFIDKDSIMQCYKDALDFIEKIIDKGYDSKEIYLNITLGTKPMSAGLALAAVTKECGNFTYIAGERDSDGIVKKGCETVYSMNPNIAVAETKLDKAKDYFNNHRYKSSQELCQEIINLVGEGAPSEQAKKINDLSKGYLCWDLFEHKKSIDILRNTLNENEFTETRKKRIGGNIQHLKKCNEDIQSEAKVGENLVVDLFSNSLRRYENNKFDDAVARLYRCLEMLGQHKLWKEHNLNHADMKLDPEIFTEKQLSILRNWKGRNQELKIGLKKVWTVIEWLEIGNNEKILKKHGFIKILNARNHSILAHGSKSVSKDTFNKFRKKIENLLRQEIPQFESISQKSKHIKLD